MSEDEEPKLSVPEEFYISVVQTCLHSLGRRGQTRHNPLEMAAHVQKIFRVPNSIHGKILKDQYSKAPETYLLRVTIIEARDVLQMDPNGLSDPYCILTLCRKPVGKSPNKWHHSQSVPEGNSPLVGSSIDLSTTPPRPDTLSLPISVTTSKSTPSSPFNSPRVSPISSPKGARLGENSPFHARRNTAHHRSFGRSRRRKSDSPAGCYQITQNELGLDAGRMRSNTEGDASKLVGNMEEESLNRTTVKTETLHPVWNETFDLEVCDANIDLLELRLTMWDWDEETSLWEAFKSLDSGHKVAGIRNIIRHVKGGINKSTDDYMGQVVIPLVDIPNATLVEKWYQIHRHHTPHHAGKVHLKLNFVRKQKPNEEVKEESKLSHYHKLAVAFYEYEGEKHLRETGTPWDGQISALSQLVLNDYAVQQGIHKLSQQLIHLSALLSFHHQKSVPYTPRPSLIARQFCFDEPDTEQAPSPGGQNKFAADTSPKKADYQPVRKGIVAGSSSVKELDPVLYDKGIREATYNVHAETIAITSLCLYEGQAKSVAEMYENNPDFLVFEMGLAEMSVCCYADLCLKRVLDVPPLFPASGLDGLEVLQTKCRLQNVHTLLSMKVWKNTETAPHRLVRDILTSTIKQSTKAWLNQRLTRMPKIEANLKPHELTEILDKLGEIMNELCGVCKPNKDYKNFFVRYHMDYYHIVAQQVDQQITSCLLDALSKLNQYQVTYQKFPENIAQSSTSSLKLYMMVKKLAFVLKQGVPDRDALQFYQFHLWFQEPLIFWLSTFKHETFERVRRALDMDKDVVLVHQVVKFSNSAVDVQACFAKVTEEWQKIGFEGPHPRCVAITKVTELICEGARLYANRVHWILEENGFYREDKETKFDIKDKLCITLNNIEHVRVYLDNLPKLLQWQKNVQDLAKEHNDVLAGKRTLETLQRLTRTASENVLMQSSTLEKKIANRMCNEVSKFMEHVVNPMEDEDHLDELMGYIDQQLETLYKQLLPQIYPRIVEDVWKEILGSIASFMQIGKPPVYYHNLRASLESLEVYFQRSGINLPSCQVKTKEYVNLDDQLKVNSKTTHELMLEYYKRVAADVAMSEEYLGHVGIKMIYGNEKKTKDSKDDSGKESRTVILKVCNCVDLPGMDRSGLSDPYVIVELLPETSLASHTVCQTRIKEQTLNPKFDEIFRFEDIPVSLIESGAVIGLTVMDHDFLVPDDYIGEVFYPLKLAQEIGNLQTVNNAAVVMLPIRRPYATYSAEFEVIRHRSQWDHDAKQFLAKRTRAIEKQKKRTDRPAAKTQTSVFASAGNALLSLCC
ncbi:protein unc-13 homolog D-like [Amphiura filiformis]|uniref:protein unc-13 homolog D-like n=1 Tax=Amphiura filiformis TaxID=82378 RepID=UPI003B211090